MDDRARLRSCFPGSPSGGRTAAASSPAASRRCCRSRGALLLNPRLLILDEPSQGLAPLIVREVFRIVAGMRDGGHVVLLVEQNVRMSLEIADHAYVLENGVVVYAGTAAELIGDEARIQALAGASAEEWAFDERAA